MAMDLAKRASATALVDLLGKIVLLTSAQEDGMVSNALVMENAKAALSASVINHGVVWCVMLTPVAMMPHSVEVAPDMVTASREVVHATKVSTE